MLALPQVVQPVGVGMKTHAEVGAAFAAVCVLLGVACRGPHIGGAGWISPVARHAHNLNVAGSTPAPATRSTPVVPLGWRAFFRARNRSISALSDVIPGG